MHAMSQSSQDAPENSAIALNTDYIKIHLISQTIVVSQHHRLGLYKATRHWISSTYP